MEVRIINVSEGILMVSKEELEIDLWEDRKLAVKLQTEIFDLKDEYCRLQGLLEAVDSVEIQYPTIKATRDYLDENMHNVSMDIEELEQELIQLGVD